METKTRLNPLRIYDYIYYSITYFHANVFGNEVTNEFVAKGLLSICQLFNLFTIFNPKKIFDDNEVILLFIVSYCIFAVLNYIRYEKIITYNQLALKWDNESKSKRRINSGLVICYFFISIILFALRAKT
jgi:hypothetical protein